VLFAVFGWMWPASCAPSAGPRNGPISVAAGASNFRIVKSHLLLNPIGLILVALTLAVIRLIAAPSRFVVVLRFRPSPVRGTRRSALDDFSRAAVAPRRLVLTISRGPLCWSRPAPAPSATVCGKLDPKLDTGK
jgi:hypothetical protein